jgi:hypothetical protein
MHSHNRTSRNITRYLSKMHHEEIEMDIKVEDEVEKYLDEVEEK